MTATHPGTLITFEGGEGGGKTTQVPLLVKRLEAAGQTVVALREPGGTKVSEQIREVVLSPENKNIAFSTEVLLFQAARAQIYAELVIPALDAGKVVLMDRSRDSSVVYQGLVRGFGKNLIEQLNSISTQDVYPDLTILLDVPVDIGLKRREKTGEVNRLDAETTIFHEKVRQTYLEEAKHDGMKRWQIVDASQPLETVEQAIWRVVEAAMLKKNAK